MSDIERRISPGWSRLVPRRPGNIAEVSTSRLPFLDRRQAGTELAASLGHHRNTDAVVLAVPRGGVVVAYQVAVALNLPLDIIVARKIGAPNQPELAIGAVASWGNHDIIIDQDSVKYLHVPEHYIESEAEKQLIEVQRRLEVYRGSAEPPDVGGRRVILIDDGIATGYTIKAAAASLRNLNVSYLCLAVPVAPSDSLAAMEQYVDELVCLGTPDPFLAVGYWYVDFSQTSDEEVVDILSKARKRQL